MFRDVLSFFIGAWFGALLTCIFLVPPTTSRVAFEKEAIANGVAEYYINEKQEKAFRWLPKVPVKAEEQK